MAENANTRTIAEALDVDQRVVRLTLRKLEKNGDIEKPDEGWQWPNEKDATYKSVLKAVKAEIDRPKARGRRSESEAPEPAKATKAEPAKATKVEPTKAPRKKAA